MKAAIVYKSVSGNTKMIAEAIRESIKEYVVYFGEPKEDIQADIYLVGSWTDKGMCSKEILEFLQSLKEKKIAYFGTAGFGSDEYYQKLTERIREKIEPENQMLGAFYCQGRMPMAMRERYVRILQENPEDKNTQVSLNNFDIALSHPDKEDEAKAQKWADEMVNSLV